MREAWCVAAALAALGCGAGAAQAQSRGYQQQAAAGAYGGGFIEFLMTGETPRPRAVRPSPLGPAGATLPAHQAAYGYGGVSAPRLQSGDPVPPGYAEPARIAAVPPAQDETRIARVLDPQFARQVVPYPGPQRPGTIVVDTPSRFLYLVQPGGQAIRYGIGVGRPGFTWAGLKTITQKREWPDWTPPAEMIRRRPDLPRHMEGGPENPLGARALYLGSSLYRIHGTNEPHTIGQSVSSGCIRMMNEDVIDLYERASVGTRVEVL
ncbi:L,D-transpeptidase [Methylobacterium durans]|uniref:L,D-transpeptidase n=1 Tax=Methylobacterium durans TaxID=2202825 RepID=UPI002AFE9593|nr:L,D-transpeptidase [Methylobacterium durans]MEA1835238.1 L,D-transpeptidase [Methylobacterium durans]